MSVYNIDMCLSLGRKNRTTRLLGFGLSFFLSDKVPI